MMDECTHCPLTNKEQQDAVIEATIKAAYLDPQAPTSLRAIVSMLPPWIKADHKRVGRRLQSLISTGAIPQLKSAFGLDGKFRRKRRIPVAAVPDDFSPQIQWYCGDALHHLRQLPDDSVDCCVTSPPYYRQMDICAEDQVGQEATAEEYIAKLVRIFTEVRRIMRRIGTLWINIGNTYQDGRSLLIPQRLALALADHGWIVRAEIVLEKNNPTPYRYEGRPTPTHEMLLLFSLNVHHYFDFNELRKGLSESTLVNPSEPRSAAPMEGSVWRIPIVRHEKGGHPAPMAIDVVRKCIAVGCPQGGTVIDPFSGIGTTLVACAEMYRHGIGIELSPYYLTLARQRFPKLARF